MGFRTLVIDKRCKLESRLGSLLIRGESEDKVHISEIETLLVESTAVALTTSLLADLSAAGVNVIFCNDRHLPESFMLSFHGNYASAQNINAQILWDGQRKADARALIIKEKIGQQSKHLLRRNRAGEAETLCRYADAVTGGDPDNFEARSAAVYFRALWGSGFSREKDCVTNDALDYGYALVTGVFAREIVSCGYMTAVGLWHRGAGNNFNLASDLMEPFRIVADYLARDISPAENNFKRHMLNLFNMKIKINGEEQYIVPAARIFVRRVFKFLNGEADGIYGIEGYRLET